MWAPHDCLPLIAASSSFPLRLLPLRSLLFMLAFAVSPLQLFGHSVLADYTRHDFFIEVGPSEIELRVEVTFYQMLSLFERHRMDVDHNGTITARDLEVYLARIDDALQQGVRLIVAGKPVNLMSLYNPEIDLQGGRRVAPTGHVVRLSFFARTPSWLQPGDEIIIEDRLWPSSPRIGSLEAIGQGAARILAGPTEERPPDPGGGPSVLRMRARCLAAPAASMNARETETAQVSAISPASTALTAVPLPAEAILVSSRQRWKKLFPVASAVMLLAGVAAYSRRRRGEHT